MRKKYLNKASKENMRNTASLKREADWTIFHYYVLRTVGLNLQITFISKDSIKTHAKNKILNKAQ